PALAWLPSSTSPWSTVAPRGGTRSLAARAPSPPPGRLPVPGSRRREPLGLACPAPRAVALAPDEFAGREPPSTAASPLPCPWRRRSDQPSARWFPGIAFHRPPAQTKSGTAPPPRATIRNRPLAPDAETTGRTRPETILAAPRHGPAA